MRQLHRIAVPLIVLGLVLAACGGAAPTAVQEIVYGDWSLAGDIKEVFSEGVAVPFMEAHPGVTVLMDGGNTDDVIAKIKAAQGTAPYDSIILGAARYLQAKQEGWIIPVEEEWFPNLKDTSPALQEFCGSHGVPFSYSMVGLMYNPEVVPEPTSWMDLWKPEYKGKIAIATPASNLGFMFIGLLGRLTTGSDTDADQAFAKLAELGDFVVAPSPEALAELLARGEIGVGIQWSDIASFATTQYPELKYVLPKPGAIVVPQCYSILNNTANLELAKDYLNRLISLEFQQTLASAPYYYGVANMKAVSPPEAVEKHFLGTPEEVANYIVLDIEAMIPLRPAWTDRFTQEFGK